MEKMKYVKIGTYNSIVIFPTIIEHSAFKHLNPITAGFCYINENSVDCFGKSYSLGIESNPEKDTEEATKQYLGIDALINLINKKTLTR